MLLFGLFLKDAATLASTNTKVFAGGIAGGLGVCFILRFPFRINPKMSYFSAIVTCCGLLL